MTYFWAMLFFSTFKGIKMSEIIFTGFGVDISIEENEYYILYDAGTIAMIEKKSKITPEEASKAQKSEKDAYEVIIATQKREGNDQPLFFK